MKSYSTIVALIAFTIACSKPPAVAVEISRICAADNEKQYVATSGYLDDRGSIFCSNIGGGRMNCGLDVVANPGGTKAFSADIEEGSGADQIEKLPKGYKKEDIRVQDNGGKIIGLSDKVTLTGQMSITPDGSVCFMTVDKIER